MLCHFMKKGHRSDLVSAAGQAKFTPTISFCPLRAFSSGRDGHLSSSCAHGNHASSCANGCSADTSSSQKSTSPKSFRNRWLQQRPGQSKCKRTKMLPLSLLTTLNYSPETNECQGFSTIQAESAELSHLFLWTKCAFFPISKRNACW